jgi:hypothetical protein
VPVEKLPPLCLNTIDVIAEFVLKPPQAAPGVLTDEPFMK